MDPAFEGVGQEAGLLIWRIEDFNVVPYPSEQYGKFYQGDSYIVLKTTEKRSGSLSWDIHFWLGSETSQDESGVAAIKSVELDDHLDGMPIQHREVEGHESAAFLSCFKGGVRYLKGGVASGFTHVDPDAPYPPRVFKVKGRRNVRVTQIDVDVSLMNKTDCFILDALPIVYVYCGPQSRRMERMKAILTANGVRDEDHAGSAQIVMIDETADSGEISGFLEALGASSLDDIPDEEETEDVEHERSQEKIVSLHRIWEDEDSVMQEEMVSELGKLTPLKQEMLNSGESGQDCFLLDTGGSGIFVWIGRESSRKEKIRSMEMAKSYLEKKQYPNWTKVERVIEKGETTIFKQYFSSWTEAEESVGMGRVFTVEQVAASLPDTPFDVSCLHQRKIIQKNVGPALGFMPDDASGQVEIFRVENFELEPIDEGCKGWFFGGDSYVIKYTYEAGGSERYIVYFWQGSASSQDEKASSAIHAVRLDNELNGKATQVRVVQGAEPEHFLRIFKGELVLFSGGKASGFKNVHDHDTYDVDGTRLFRVRGTCDFDVRALQMPEEASSLNSDDVYVLETPQKTYLWSGANASEEEKKMGSSMAQRLSPDQELVEVIEGEEDDDFWSSLGGQGDYCKAGTPSRPSLNQRLFHCSISPAGRLRVREVHSFSQSDLNEDDVMILDSGDELYVWIGKDASDEEKEKGMEIAKEYVDTDPTSRSLDSCVILRLNEGEEPHSFIDLFPSWNPSMWEELPSYEDLKAQIAEQNAAL